MSGMTERIGLPQQRAAGWIVQVLRFLVIPELLTMAARVAPDVVPIAIPVFVDAGAM
jgi:hypothetical protein